jgi:hypothetical protein
LQIDLDNDKIEFPANPFNQNERNTTEELLADLRAPHECAVLEAGIAVLQQPSVALADLAVHCDPLEALTRISSQTFACSRLCLLLGSHRDEGSSDHSAHNLAQTASMAAARRVTVASVGCGLDSLRSTRAAATVLTRAEREAGLRWLVLRFLHELVPDINNVYCRLSTQNTSDDIICNSEALIYAAEIHTERCVGQVYARALVCVCVCVCVPARVGMHMYTEIYMYMWFVYKLVFGCQLVALSCALQLCARDRRQQPLCWSLRKHGR